MNNRDAYFSAAPKGWTPPVQDSSPKDDAYFASAPNDNEKNISKKNIKNNVVPLQSSISSILGQNVNNQSDPSVPILRDLLKGADQSLLNTPEEAANVFGKHIYNKFNFAPNTEAGKLGGNMGDIASYFIPSGIFSGALKTASLVPKAREAINAVRGALQESPITNYLLNMGKNAGEAALFEKEKNPQASSIDVLKSAGYGGAIPATIGAFTSTNPIISTLAKLGIGGAIGYHQGGIPGAMEGAALGVGIPKGIKELGIGASPISSEFLTQSPNALAQARYEAGNRLGTPLRPSEAFNSPGIARNEGMISRSEVGGQAMAELGQARIGQQKNAINNLLNTIYDKSDAASNNIRNLYQKAFRWNLKPDAVNSLMEDPVIAQAFKKVESDPAYQRKLNGIDNNNYAYLDQVKRALDDMSGSALKSGEKVRAAEYSDAKNQMINMMDKAVPDYANARAEAQKSIIRSQIEKKLGTKPITGNNFFNTFLANDNKFNDLHKSLQNVPEAQQQLTNMKTAWEHLIGIETPRSAAGSSARSMSSAREEMSALWNKYKDTIGAPRDIQRAQFIHDPKWWDKFDEVMQYKDKLQRNEDLGNLLSRGFNAGLLTKANNSK